MSKKTLRKDMIESLNAIDNSTKKQYEEKLYEKLFKYIDDINVKSVGIVLSMPHEINTWPIIHTLNDRDIDVFSPKCDYVSKDMNFYQVHHEKEIKKDEKGILIPDDSNALNNDMDLLIVPGLIFNETGYRTGYGGGFYDRFLKTFNGQTVSILFDEQFGEVIIEPHDIPVDCIISPTRKINAKVNRQTNE